MKELLDFVLILMVTLFALEIQAQPSYIYEGGIGYGYSSGQDDNNSTYLYKGGQEIGTAYAAVGITNSLFLYKGGQENGTAYAAIGETNTLALYKGGPGDGYDSDKIIHDFIWTGAVGTGWTVAGNWSNNVVPWVHSNVIIPSGVPNYPFVNTGIFAIGENPNNGAYKCRELWIQQNALLVTRINCKVENYGLIKVDGELRIKRKAADAFLGKAGSEVLVSPTGLFNFQ